MSVHQQAMAGCEEADEAFEDAAEDIPVISEMDLATSIEETTVALNLFLNNHFTAAMERMKPWADRSMYHALGYSTILYLQASLTFEMADIQAAIAAAKQSVAVCDRYRKRQSMLSRTNYSEFTEEQMHAELCYAETLIERALLTFVQDENLINFVKGGLKVRSCHIAYKECVKLLEKAECNKCHTTATKIHFESGVKLGVGIFNLMISLLPTRVLKLLEFIGFSGNKQKGLKELEAGAVGNGLRNVLCTLSLLVYHTVMTYVLGTADGDIPLCEKLLKPCLQNYPKGALFLFFAGRIEEIKGHLDEAIYKFEESIEVQTEWKQFHHICYWELMWCHAFKQDWLLAMKYAERLCHESRWSKATYTYQKAAFLLSCQDTTDDSKAHIDFLMTEVPKLKQRIAGKSLPIEKFAVKKAKRFFDQKSNLTLPSLELIYVWNGFMIIGKRPDLIEVILNTVEEKIREINANKDNLLFYHDDYCLALLLKGVCLKYRDQGQEFQAEQCFREIWTLEKKLKEDHYIVPFALLELAMLFIQSNNLEEAKNILDKAKNGYKGYSLESRLHFRVHAAKLQLKTLQNENGIEESDNSYNDAPSNSNSINDDFEKTPTPPSSPE